MKNEAIVYQYTGEGLAKLYINDAWTVGIKNYKQASDMSYMDRLERHILTDELFAPFSGKSILITAEKSENELNIKITLMEIGKIYSVQKGMWHNVVMERDSSMVLIENSETCMENTEVLELSDKEIKQLKDCVSKG